MKKLNNIIVPFLTVVAVTTAGAQISQEVPRVVVNI